MGWFDRLTGRNTGAEIDTKVQRALTQYKDQIRVDVLTEVRGQMNRVFEVVDDLKTQVNELTLEKNELSRRLGQMELSLRETSERVRGLDNVVRESAAKNARGLTEVAKRLTEIGVQPGAAGNTASGGKPAPA